MDKLSYTNHHDLDSAAEGRRLAARLLKVTNERCQYLNKVGIPDVGEVMIPLSHKVSECVELVGNQIQNHEIKIITRPTIAEQYKVSTNPTDSKSNSTLRPSLAKRNSKDRSSPCPSGSYFKSISATT